MLNANINYPYPIIREYVEDYQTTVFKGALVVNLQPDGYLVRPNFEIQNAGISGLIAEGKMTYALESFFWSVTTSPFALIQLIYMNG